MFLSFDDFTIIVFGITDRRVSTIHNQGPQEVFRYMRRYELQTNTSKRQNQKLFYSRKKKRHKEQIPFLQEQEKERIPFYKLERVRKTNSFKY